MVAVGVPGCFCAYACLPYGFYGRTNVEPALTRQQPNVTRHDQNATTTLKHEIRLLLAGPVRVLSLCLSPSPRWLSHSLDRPHRKRKRTRHPHSQTRKENDMLSAMDCTTALSPRTTPRTSMRMSGATITTAIEKMNTSRSSQVMHSNSNSSSNNNNNNDKRNGNGVQRTIVKKPCDETMKDDSNENNSNNKSQNERKNSKGTTPHSSMPLSVTAAASLSSSSSSSVQSSPAVLLLSSNRGTIVGPNSHYMTEPRPTKQYFQPQQQQDVPRRQQSLPSSTSSSSVPIFHKVLFHKDGQTFELQRPIHPFPKRRHRSRSSPVSSSASMDHPDVGPPRMIEFVMTPRRKRTGGSKGRSSTGRIGSSSNNNNNNNASDDCQLSLSELAGLLLSPERLVEHTASESADRNVKCTRQSRPQSQSEPLGP